VTSTQLTVAQQKMIKVKEDMDLAELMVMNVLEKGLDWGLHPGTSSFALKDPGASTLINAFNCYPQPKILYREVTEVKIAYVLNVYLISREDKQVKATGTGACTTLETKYGYRWVPDPENYGYDRKDLKKRTRGEQTFYRIPNPDWSELENTILKMARKRAEVDAALGLPGVARSLTRLYTGAGSATPATKPSDEWSGFWTRAKALGFTPKKVHDLLGVDSVKYWVDDGHTLNEAIELLSKKLADLPHESPFPPDNEGGTDNA